MDGNLGPSTPGTTCCQHSSRQHTMPLVPQPYTLYNPSLPPMPYCTINMGCNPYDICRWYSLTTPSNHPTSQHNTTTTPVTPFSTICSHPHSLECLHNKSLWT